MSVFNFYCNTLYKQIYKSTHTLKYTFSLRRFPRAHTQSVDCAKNFDELLILVMRSYKCDCLLGFFSLGIKYFNEQFNADKTQYLLIMINKKKTFQSMAMVEHSVFALESQ